MKMGSDSTENMTLWKRVEIFRPIHFDGMRLLKFCSSAECCLIDVPVIYCNLEELFIYGVAAKLITKPLVTSPDTFDKFSYIFVPKVSVIQHRIESLNFLI